MSLLSLDPQHHASLLQRAPAPASVGAQLRCAEGQAAVFVAAGRVAGVLGPGHHVLDPRNIAFLAPIVQQRPSGLVLGDDLYFAKTGLVQEVPFSGALPTVLDPAVGERVTPRFRGSVVVSLVDPVPLLAVLTSRDGPEQLVRVRAEARAQSALTNVKRLAELVRPETWREQSDAVARTLRPALAEIGVALSSVQIVAVEIPDDVAARLRLVATSFTQPGTEQVAPALAVGARVRTTREGQWYSGRITQQSDASSEVEWDGGGQRSWVPTADLEPEPRYPGAHASGTRVLAERVGAGYLAATVRAFNGMAYEVAWEDGATAWLSPGQVRPS